MTTYTVTDNHVLTDDAKIFCTCRNHGDALRVADAMNWSGETDSSPYFNWVINIMKQIPIQKYLRANRYDTDEEHVLYLWNDAGKSFYFRCPREEFVGRRPALEDGVYHIEYIDDHLVRLMKKEN